MDPISILEKRLEELELKVLPTNTSVVPNKTQDITTLLLETQTMITSALSCREAITSMLQYMTTINDYLDPCSGVDEILVEAKRQYLLELYGDIKTTVQSIASSEPLLQLVNSVNIMKITELSDRIEQLSVSNLTIHEECKAVTQNVLKVLQQYSDIIYSIKVLFAQLDVALSQLENNSLLKLVIE